MQGTTARIHTRLSRSTTARKQHTKRKRAARKRRFLFILLLLLVAVTSFTLGSFLSSARGNREEDPSYFKYYKNIEVKAGDTLHSLAEEYNEPSVSSDHEYVSEIRKLNHMKSSGLIPGQSLIITYYDTEYK